MTDAVAVALVVGGFGTVNAAVGAVGLIISRKVRDAARISSANHEISQANHETLTRVVANTDGNVRKLQDAWEKEALRRESEAWAAAYEAGRLAEITKNRRKTDMLPLPANDEEPKE